MCIYVYGYVYPKVRMYVYAHICVYNVYMHVVCISCVYIYCKMHMYIGIYVDICMYIYTYV